MDRRTFLAYSSAGVLAAGLGPGKPAYGKSITPGSKLTDSTEPVDGLLGWDEFLDRAVSAGSSLVKDRTQGGQDTYLYTLGALAARLGELPEVSTRDFGGLNPSYELDLIYRDPSSPFVVLYWKMQPGTIFPAHCHPGANVCTLCTSGRSIIRNFDTVQGSPECWIETDEEFEVVETKSEILRPGVINAVTEFRNNIHRFEAGPDGAEGIDITTGYDEQPKPFSFLKLDDRKTASSGEVGYAGRWVGKDIKAAL
jgi:hypothetical protein